MMLNLKKSLLTLAAASMLSVSAMADTTNLLTDGNLDETPTNNSWVADGGGYKYATAKDYRAYKGDYYVVLKATNGFDSSLTQTFATVAGTTYTVTFDYISTGGGAQFGLQDGDASSSTWIDYQTLSNTASSTDWTAYTYINSTTGTTTFTALSDLTTIGFVATGKGAKLYLNNIAVTAMVPEPASMALFLAGLGALGLVSRRRRVK